MSSVCGLSGILAPRYRSVMSTFRPSWLLVLGGLCVTACVGDNPTSSSSSSSGDGGSSGVGAGSSSGSSSGAVDGDSGASSSSGGADAGTDGAVSVTCDPSKPFSTATLEPAFASAADEYDIWVSADELTAYLSINDYGPGELRKSVRTSRDEPFPTPTEVAELDAVNDSTSSVSSPSLSANGLRLYFRGNGTNKGAFVSERAALDQPFGVPQQVTVRGGPRADAYGDVFYAASAGHLFLASGSTYSAMMIGEHEPDLDGTYTEGTPTAYSFQPGGMLGTINSEPADDIDRRPVTDADGLILLFASNRSPASGTNLDLYEARRAGIGGEFAAPVRLAEPVNSPGEDRPGSLSADGCTMYFTSNRPGGAGGFDVYRARRAP